MRRQKAEGGYETHQEEGRKGVREEGKHRRHYRRAKGGDIFVGLHDSARRAFTSFLQAYPTKEKIVRHIFSTWALHLGHVT